MNKNKRFFSANYFSPEYLKTGLASPLSAKIWTLLVAIIILSESILVMYGWMTQNAALVQMNPLFSPMQFNTALLLFFSALGLISLCANRYHLGAFIGVGISLFGAATLLQYVLKIDLYIDQIFITPFTAVETSDLGRMSPQSAFNFILTGILFGLYLRKEEWLQGLRFFMATVIFTLSVSAALGYLFNLESAYGWGSLTRMSLQTSICFSFISLCFMAFNWQSYRIFWPAALIFFLGLLMAMFVLQIITSSGEAQAEAVFYSEAKERVLSFKRNLHTTRRLLRGIRALYDGSDNVTRRDYAAFIDRFVEHKEILQALDWVEYIPQERRAAYENQLRLEGFEGLTIKELRSEGGFISASYRPEYYPVTYTEPFIRNQEALGFDYGSREQEKLAIEAARDRNDTVVTQPLKLFRELDAAAKGIFFVEPIYQNHADLSTLEQRRAAFRGVISAVVRLPLFIGNTMGERTSKPLQFYFMDITDSSKPIYAYGPKGVFKPEELEGLVRKNFKPLSGLFYTERVSFGGRKYQALVIPDSVYQNHQQTIYPTATFFLMLMLNLAASFFVAQAILRRRDSEIFSTELKHESEVSEYSRSNLQAVLDSATAVAIITTDTKGKIKVFNRGAEKMLGWKASEVIDIRTPAIFHLEEEVQARSAELTELYGKKIEGFDVFVEAAKRGAVEEREWTYVRKDGSHFSVSLVITAVHNARYEITGFLGVAMDITHRKIMEKELKAISEGALEASRAKSDFLATMSHEIRTPMNAILGMAELLAETPLTDDQKQYVSALSRGGETLLSLINDVLDLSKIESGVIDIEEESYSIHEVVERVVEVLAVAAHRKKIELNVSVGSEVPKLVLGDASRVRQVLLNLVGNAVKFTEKGEVTLELKASGNELCFSVRDTGIGIAKDKINAVFEPFTQADSSTTRKYGGTGLGLSISKKLTELMGGSIRVESELGKGSCFYFNLPLRFTEDKRSESPGGKGAAPAVLKGKKVLIVDDNTTNRLIIRKTVTQWGMEAEEASSGQECLDRILAKKMEGSVFDLILLDCRMPGMGGFDVAEKLKRDDLLQIPMVVMLTSDGRSGDMERARNAGFEAYLIKPVRGPELLRVVSNVFLKREVSRVPDAPGLPPTASASGVKKILLVEDSLDNQELVKAYLKNQPYEIDLAENGKAAVQQTECARYDLVLMDMQMPEMDGYTATRLIREREKKNKIVGGVKIIALTANALQQDAEKCLAAGCNAYLSKPIKKATLIEAIGKHLDFEK